MHRSSDTIATFAAALTKAQVELTNPEKSLVATIRSPFPREADRTFRYAPLSSGLDIVRKTLGRHEIATIQATEIDKEAGLLRLTTVLAHSSGEWISSDWPVCQISDIASAQRVGAALTYGRRYALFTLVGIAGEDDLDAPDLGDDPTPTVQSVRPSGQANGQPEAGRRADRNRKRPKLPATNSVLGEQLSASLRESLIEQMASINSADEAAAWAHRNLPAKNKLRAADAKIVEVRFQERLSQIEFTSDGLPHDVPPKSHASADVAVTALAQKSCAITPKRSARMSLQDLGKTVRLRDKDHQRFVVRQACLVCGRVPSDPHHLTFTQPRALGRRVSDEFMVPVCRMHHRELHRSGNEAAWWRRLNIDPVPVALRLWQQTRSEDRAPATPDPRTEAKPAAQGAPSDRASETSA
jgi:ERF superfamily